MEMLECRRTLRRPRAIEHDRRERRQPPSAHEPRELSTSGTASEVSKVAQHLSQLGGEIGRGRGEPISSPPGMARFRLVIAQPTGECRLPRCTLDECGGRRPRFTKRGAARQEVIQARFGGRGVRDACVSLRIFVSRACVRELRPHRRD